MTERETSATRVLQPEQSGISTELPARAMPLQYPPDSQVMHLTPRRWQRSQRYKFLAVRPPRASAST